MTAKNFAAERIAEGLDDATDVSDGMVVNFECLFAGDDEIDSYELEASTSPARDSAADKPRSSSEDLDGSLSDKGRLISLVTEQQYIGG